MKTYKHLFKQLYCFDNIQRAYELAKKRKSNSRAVKEFNKNWRLNLCVLMRELRTKTYKPLPLKKFILRDPKTRVICVSDFRDRVVHHAVVNILNPVFEPRFIYDSHASRKGKGTLTALDRFDRFIRKVSKNGRRVLSSSNTNVVEGFVFKADISKYFDTVDHQILLDLIAKRVKDKEFLWLVKIILNNYNSGIPGKGMPLGNWTSQFFANVYLNELDQYVKHILKIKYYIRYVDDFVILHSTKTKLKEYELKINNFLKKLKIELHSQKCKIVPLGKGVTFLGFRVFYHYKRVRKRNMRKIKAKLVHLYISYENGFASAYDVLDVFFGWNGYAMQGNSYNIREKLKKEVQNELQIRNQRRKKNRESNNVPKHSKKGFVVDMQLYHQITPQLPSI